jgi:hypothetical protein
MYWDRVHSKDGKEEADKRVERSLCNRAISYSYDAEKIFCDKNGKVTRVPYVEHVPPDVTACIFWLKNRKPPEWRDVRNKVILCSGNVAEESGSRTHQGPARGPSRI